MYYYTLLDIKGAILSLKLNNILLFLTLICKKVHPFSSFKVNNVNFQYLIFRQI